MQILSVHNRYRIRGGEEECYEAETTLLKERGHTVAAYEKDNGRVSAANKLQMAIETIWSGKAYSDLTQQLRNRPYNVVHLHNFFPLISPSVYYAAKAEGVSVVQTLHNYRLLCPNALFFREGKVCEDCLGKFVPYPGVLHGCYRDNRVESAATASMLTVHRTMGTWTNTVDRYITLTNFAREKLIQGGLPAEKIVVKPNFVDPDPGVGSGSGGYALYVGRISVEKGIDVLLEAWEKLSMPVPLKIVGDGPLADLVVQATKRFASIEWLGRRPMSEVHKLMGEAMFLVFPSKWYETFGRVAIEAFAKGTPVIASKIGAMVELINDEHTGLHFQPSVPEDLAAKVEWALANPQKLALMRGEARAEYEAKYTAEINYQQLIDIYQNLSNASSG